MCSVDNLIIYGFEVLFYYIKREAVLFLKAIWLSQKYKTREGCFSRANTVALEKRFLAIWLAPAC